MDPFVVFALTSFAFLHLITLAAAIFFYTKLRQKDQELIKLSELFVNFSNNVGLSISQLRQLILATSPLGMAAQALGGIPGAGPGLTVSEAEGIEANGDSDPDEDDDITTLGEMIG